MRAGYLVRRAPPGPRWHEADDNLAGTASYGAGGYGNTDPNGMASFSVPFADLLWGEMYVIHAMFCCAAILPNVNDARADRMLASGDLSMWLVLDRGTVEECSVPGFVPQTIGSPGQWFPHPVAGSDAGEAQAERDDESGVLQYCRQGVPEDPWLSVGEHPSKIVCEGTALLRLLLCLLSRLEFCRRRRGVVRRA